MTVLYALTHPTGLVSSAVIPRSTSAGLVRAFNGMGINFNSALTQGDLPLAVVPSTGTLMWQWAISSNNYSSTVALNKYNARINNWYFMKNISGAIVTVYFRRSDDTFVNIRTFEFASALSAAAECIVQFSPTTIKVISNGVTLCDLSTSETPKNELGIGWRNYESEPHVVSEVTLHDTAEVRFFPVRQYDFSQSANSGWAGDVEDLKTTSTSAVTAGIGALLTLNITAQAAGVLPGNGGLIGTFLHTAGLSDLAPYKLKETLKNGATEIANTTHTFDAAYALKYGFVGTAIPTVATLEVLAS